MRFRYVAGLVAASMLGLTALSGCNTQVPEAVDGAVDDAGEAVDDAAEATDEAIDDAGEAVDGAAETTDDAVDGAVEDVENTAE